MAGFQPIFDAAALDLFQALGESLTDATRDALQRDLVRHLRGRCALPAVQARFDAYRTGAVDPIAAPAAALTRYPLAADGFARSFDPLTEEEAFWDCWRVHGVVVGCQIAAPMLCAEVRRRMAEVLRQLSGDAVDLDAPATYGAIPVDADGTPFVSRGFFELYHDHSLAALRQQLRLYLHHVAIWGRADLWTTFDRLGLKLAGHAESGALPLHVDQNPAVHPDFRTVQGVLALDDCPRERGTYVAVPGSRGFFADYPVRAGYRGEYVELPHDGPLHDAVAPHAQPLPLRAGDLVSWDSRTTHTNTANLSDRNRYVAYVAAGPARESDAAAVAARADAVASGLGSNVRDALMHASKKPRYTAPDAVAPQRIPERLTALGRLLYGRDRYADL